MSTQTQNQSVYICGAGESFDLVALIRYGDMRYAAELLGANPHLCHLLRFTGGEALTLPWIDAPRAVDETGAGVVTPPWKQG